MTRVLIALALAAAVATTAWPAATVAAQTGPCSLSNTSTTPPAQTPNYGTGGIVRMPSDTERCESGGLSGANNR